MRGTSLREMKEVGVFTFLLFKFSFIYFFGLKFSLVAVHGLLLTVASPIVEHGISGAWTSVAVACRLYSTDSVVTVHRLKLPLLMGS